MRSHLTNDEDFDYCVSWYTEEGLYDHVLTSIIVEYSENARHWDNLVHFYMAGDVTDLITDFFFNGRNFEETSEFIRNMSKGRCKIGYTRYTKTVGDLARSGQSQTLF